MSREEMVKKFGIEVVEDDEKTWKERGYKINYQTNLLEKCTCAECSGIPF